MEPGEQGLIVLPDWLTMGARRSIPKWLAGSQGFLFGPDGQLGVAIGGFQADVTEPSANDVDLDPGLEEMYCGRMPEQMRRNPP